MPDPTWHSDDLDSLVMRMTLGRRLRVIGVFGVAAAIALGVLGWVLVGRVTSSLTTTFEPMSEVVSNISDTISASESLVSRTTEALTSIESATRSTARTIESLNAVLGETSEVAGGEIADGLDSAVDTLPGLISTARVVDRTMRTLSLLGVDYDPDQPLDESLSELEASLRPVPDQIRDQVRLLEEARSDIEVIVGDADQLASVLAETRLEMTDAKDTLADAAISAAAAAEGVVAISEDLDTFRSISRYVVLLAAVAAATAAMTPLLVGIYFMRSDPTAKQ